MNPRFAPTKAGPAVKDAAWLDWSGETRSIRLESSQAAFRPFRDLGVRLLGIDRLKGTFHAGSPCSSTHLVWMVTRGTIEVDWGDGLRAVGKGEMVLCPALRPHWVRLASNSATGLWVHFERVPSWQHLSKAGPGVHRIRNAARIEGLLEQCIAESGSTEFGAARNALDFARIVAVMLERELIFLGKRNAEQPVISRLETLWAAVMEHPEAPWTVSKLASAAGTSARELHRLCANLYGIGPMGLVTRLRMDRSMELLLATDRKIEDIATEVGYTTAHAFSTAFLSHVGKRPGRFREDGGQASRGPAVR